jgi:Zn-dependent peptidase ImmA (M78 family)
LSALSILRHPDYPFRPGWEGGYEACDQAFLDAPPAGSGPAALLREFVILTHRFAFLERLVQGDVLYELPVHLRPRTGPSDPETEGEDLAAAERNLLDWIGPDAAVLPELLDDIGIKVLAQDPGVEDAEEEGREQELRGAFSYEGKIGPALLVGTRLDRAEALFVLAHEFAHLVADVNPYRARFCRWDARTLENRLSTTEERRADHFARALLLPENRLREVLAQLGPGPKEESGDDLRAQQLSVFFDVPPTLLRRRLDDLKLPSLGLPPSRALEAPEAPLAPAGGPAGAPPVDRLSLPQRYVHLALAIFSRRLMEIEELALFLRTAPEGAQEMLDWAQIPRRVDIPQDDE